MSPADFPPNEIERLKQLVGRRAKPRLARPRAQASSAEALIAHLRLRSRSCGAAIWPAQRAQGAPARPDGAAARGARSRQHRGRVAAERPPRRRNTSSASRAGGRRASRSRRICRASASSCPAPRPAPAAAGRLAKLGEDVTETLEVVPRQWKVIQTVREKFSCRDCEKITQPPAPFHVIAARLCRPEPAGDDPVREVRPASAAQPAERALCPRGRRLEPVDAGRSGRRLRGGAAPAARADPSATSWPPSACMATTPRCRSWPRARRSPAASWVYVRDDRPFGGPDPPAALFYLLARSRRRASRAASRRLCRHPAGRCLCRLSAISTTAGASRVRSSRRRAGAMRRRKFFELADIAAKRGAASWPPISPIAFEAVSASTRSSTSSARSTACRRASVWPCASEQQRAAGRRARSLDARRARQAVAPRRCRQGDRLHAHALAGLHPLPRRRPHLPHEQRRRTRAARHRPGPEIMAIRRLGARRRARRGHVHADRDRLMPPSA